MLVVRKAKKKIVRPDGMHEAWVYQSATLSPITFKEVIKECAESCGEHPSKTTGVVTALMDRIAHYLKIGRTVQIDGIGTLKPTFNAHSAETPEGLSGQSVYKVKVQFYPHKDFQGVLNKMEFVDMDTLNENPDEAEAGE